MKNLLPGIAAALIAAVPISAKTARSTMPPKLIEYGWDCPNTAYLRENIAQMETRPFDGVVIQVTRDSQPRQGGSTSLGWQVFGKERFQPKDYQRALDDLKATRFHQFRRNFIQVISSPGVDWFDPEWSAVADNAKVMARIARQGGCAGLMLDPEEYTQKLWTYSALPEDRRKQFSTEQYAAQVLKRGEEFIRAINSEFPKITILFLLGPSYPVGRDDYDLLAPFVEGMSRAAARGTKIVDGYEQCYSCREQADFERGRQRMKSESRELFQDKSAFDRVMRVGFGLWMDYNSGRRGWDTTDFSRNFFTPEQFGNSIRQALTLSDDDGFVWIYSERFNWWTGEHLPDAYVTAVEQARANPKP